MEWKALLFSIAIVLFSLIILVYAWYDYPGAWTSFNVTTGENLNINVPTGKNFYNLRFKKCIFTIYNTDGSILSSTDVTGTLNNICKSYGLISAPAVGITTTQHPLFNLLSPLNIFSFNTNTFAGITPATKVSKCIQTTNTVAGSGMSCMTNNDCASQVISPNPTAMPAAKDSTYGKCLIQNIATKSCPKLSSSSAILKQQNCNPICVTNSQGTNVWACNPINSSLASVAAYPGATGLCQVCDTEYMVSLSGYYRTM